MSDGGYVDAVPTQRISNREITVPIGWTIDTFSRFMDERDRRYTEVAIEREKALKIKEVADRDAMDLARSAQIYREAQNDAMRDKNLSQSGIYATTASVAQGFAEFRAEVRPLLDYVQAVKGSATNKIGLYMGASFIGVLIAAAGWLTR